MVTELLVFFYCRKRPRMNLASQVTVRDLEPAGRGTVSGSCNSQLALFTTERQRDLRPAVKFRKPASSAGLCKLKANS